MENFVCALDRDLWTFCPHRIASVTIKTNQEILNRATVSWGVGARNTAMNSFDNLRCPIWKSQAALVALKSNSKYFQTNDLSHTGPPLSVSCFPNSTVIISSWKGSLSTFLMNLKVPIWSFVAENTFPIFKVLITSVESEKLFNFSPYSVLPIPGPIWGKRLQPLRYSFPWAGDVY